MNTTEHSPSQEPQGGSGAMFDGIAQRYDLLNRLISFGVDKRWRKKTVEALELPADSNVLDLATGTGDLAFDILKAHQDATVIGVDPSTNMLSIGNEKAQKFEMADRFETKVGVGEELPFESNTFDGACIAFGIRNCVDRDKALSELFRVLKPKNKLAILELGQPSTGLFQAAARFHINHVVPTIGSLLSGSKEYRYLQKSISAFPPPETFVTQIEQAGFKTVTFERLTFDSCHLYVGSKG